MSVIEEAKTRIKGKALRIVLPEGGDERIGEAARILKAEGLAEPVVFAPSPPEPQARHVGAVLARRPGMSEGAARRLLARPLFMGGAMLATGEAAAMAAGVAHPTARVIEAGLMTVGLERRHRGAVELLPHGLARPPARLCRLRRQCPAHGGRTGGHRGGLGGFGGKTAG